MPSPLLSLVIPVYNEAPSLAQLHQEIGEVVRAGGYDVELILVDDGSSDGSWQKIAELAATDPRVRGIRLRRNFGKAAALSAGFDAAEGEIIFTLDADLQDNPKEIPRFLEKLAQDLDVVSGWKKVRRDPWRKVLPSRIFNWLVGRLTGVKLHDHNCGFKCYRREVFDEVRLYGELHRFVPVLAAARGFRVGEIEVHHRPRQFGKSKYGARRFFKGFLDLFTVKFLTGFRHRPSHLLGGLGLFFFLFGAIALTFLAGWWVGSRVWEEQLGPPIHLHQRALFFYSLGALLLGGQFLSVGFLAELITANSGRDADTYSIAEETPPRETINSVGPSPGGIPS